MTTYLDMNRKTICRKKTIVLFDQVYFRKTLYIEVYTYYSYIRLNTKLKNNKSLKQFIIVYINPILSLILLYLSMLFRVNMDLRIFIWAPLTLTLNKFISQLNYTNRYFLRPYYFFLFFCKMFKGASKTIKNLQKQY